MRPLPEAVTALVEPDPEWEYQRFDLTAVAACILAPAIMWVAEMAELGEAISPRGSISAYHDVVPPGAFFIPLTVAVMLFVVNGWLVAGHRIHMVMGAYLLGVILFDHDGRTMALHFAFAGYFFVTGAFLDAARDGQWPAWSPERWLVMGPVLPFWLVTRRWSRVRSLWHRAAAILAPFLLLGAVVLVADWTWLDDHWLFIAEWIALTVVVVQYLTDARRHAHEAASAAATD